MKLEHNSAQQQQEADQRRDGQLVGADSNCASCRACCCPNDADTSRHPKCRSPSPSSSGDSGHQQSGAADCLLYYDRQPLKLKSFDVEYRGLLDVEQFVYQSELLLDLDEVSMDKIIQLMLLKVVESENLANNLLDEAREMIFVRGSASLLAHTIQGVQQVAGNKPTEHMSHDHSWMCALCDLPQVSRRHMVIARFKRPVNMGENAHEIRLFMLVVAPTDEKATKNSLDTGRTFATMLADCQLRQELLHAKSELEFKTRMLLKAKQLANSTTPIKNRHKYLLDARIQHSISISSLGADDVRNSTTSFSSSALILAKEADSRRQLDANDNNNNATLFNRNPRTSRLFEVIDLKRANECHQQAECDFHADERQMKFGQIGELSKQSSSSSSSSCCGFICSQVEFGAGLWSDFTNRLRWYPSDYLDAFVGPPRTIQKTVATIWFLYFGILLPTIAFSSLNTTQTSGHMGDLRKAIIGQAAGGLFFALLGGQPLVIIMTTAPLCLYTHVIHRMCADFGFDFLSMYAAVGLWNGFFLLIYSLLGFSKLMKWCTRSTEEVFAMFIVIAFITDAGKDMMKNFHQFYYTEACEYQNNLTAVIQSNESAQWKREYFLSHSPRLHSNESIESELESTICRRETSLLFLLLMLGTLWLAVALYKFRKTSYLSAAKRNLLSDYALPAAVILMSFVGSFVFDRVYVETLPPSAEIEFVRAKVEELPISGILTAAGLGFTLSLLFFMDQNISAAMVAAPEHKLKKGNAYHYDLLVVAVLNGLLALFGLPMMHGVLPHSPLHAKSLADIECRVEEGHPSQVIVHSRETRVTAIVAHLLILASILLIPYPIAYIPRAVLNGLFLYMAVTSLDGLQMFERISLLFTQQSKYPPNHYIRRCPQRNIHKFTLLQLIQLLVMCLFGFSPVNVVEMFFPVIILLMIPFRYRVVPRYIEQKHLNVLDGKHD